MPYGSALKLQKHEAERCSFPLRLDVYGSGCDHHCSYCYARAQMIIGGWNNSKNPSHPFPRVANLECIKKTLSEIPKKKPECVAGSWKQIRPLLTNKLPLRIGAVTDCFQRYMESKTHTGLELLRILSDSKYPAQIVTKSDVIAESDYIDAMKDNKNNLLLQLSITSPSDAISRVIESGAPLTSHRIKALTKLVKEGFFTAVRINPLFPIFPDKTLVKLSKETDIRGISLIKRAKELKVKKLPIFDLKLISKIISVFEQAPPETKNKHTIIAGFARLPFVCVKWVSEAIGWQPNELKEFFSLKQGNCYYYSTEEIRHYYEAIKQMCQKTKTPFSICYDSDRNYNEFKDIWENPKDCCNAVGLVKGFKKVYSDCC